MKKAELVFASIQVPVDYCMLLIAAVCAYKIRFVAPFTDIVPVFYSISGWKFLSFAAIAALIWIFMFFLNGLYNLKITRTFRQELASIFVASSAAVLVIVVMIFLNRYLFSSRFIIITAWIASMILVAIGRFIVLKIQKFVLKKGIGTHRVVIIGKGRMGVYVRQECMTNPSLGYTVVEFSNEMSDEFMFRLKTLANERQIDEIIITDTDQFSSETKERLFHFSMTNHIILKYTPDFSAMSVSKIISDTSIGIPLIEICKTTLDGWGRIVKRAFDVVGSALGLVILSPLFALIAIGIKIDSPGYVIYKNERVGQRGRLFKTYKFRTMKTDFCVTSENKNNAEALAYERELIQQKSKREGPVYKVIDDPRRTTLGKLLERTSLDELPQLYNVFTGTMSLVGPRPHQEREVAKYNDYHKRLLDIKPGMTGLAQTSGRSDLDFEDEYRLDMYYIENWSFWLDIFILIKTIWVVIVKSHR